MDAEWSSKFELAAHKTHFWRRFSEDDGWGVGWPLDLGSMEVCRICKRVTSGCSGHTRDSPSHPNAASVNHGFSAPQEAEALGGGTPRALLDGGREGDDKDCQGGRATSQQPLEVVSSQLSFPTFAETKSR